MSALTGIPQIRIHDSLAAHLGGPEEITNFSLSILDVARLAGHLCPSVAGAFLITQAAVNGLFPNGVCERGLLQIDIPGSDSEGVNGPMAQVMSYITGAWPQTGFAGLHGQYVRKNLMHFNSDKVQKGHFRFTRLDTSQVIEVAYFPNRAEFSARGDESFEDLWQKRVSDILSAPQVIEVFEV